VQASLKEAPEKVMCEVVRAKPKTQWKSQEVRDARNIEYLPRKTVGSEHSQPKRKREPMWVAVDNVIGVEPFGTHIMPFYALDAGCGDAGFNVCPAGVWSCFGPVLPWYSSIPQFWNGNVYCVTICWKYIICFLILQWFTAKSLP
jgi:hypothetical protein